jgi:hypothetical protein
MISKAFTAVPITTDPIVKTVTEDELLEEELADAEAAKLALQDMALRDPPTPSDDKDTPVPPYPDPFIKPPVEPPPTRPKKAPHIIDIQQPTRTPKHSLASKCRDWQGHSPPVPNQTKCTKEIPCSQLLTELWHHQMGHPGTPKLRKTQQHTTGIPMLGPLHPLFGCNNCNIAKLTKQARGKEDVGAAQINGK